MRRRSDTNRNSTERRSSAKGEHSYPIGEGELASEAVYTAIAELIDRSPMELAPLASVIDPDALDAVVTSGDSSPDPGRVSFEYEDYRVTVTTDEVVLDPQ